MLKIENLHAGIGGQEILKGLSLNVNAGEVHAIMGPNGSGKSTLSKLIAGHPSVEVTSGSIQYEINMKMQDLLDLEPEERAREGVFLAFQYPIEVPGVSNFEFLHTAFNEVCKHQGVSEMSAEKFRSFLIKKSEIVDMDPRFLDRDLNAGFSGGEKKRNEILQMAVLNPRLAVLDETDSGLDIDALRTVASGVNNLRSSDNAIILITHYQRLLDYIKPDFVHILVNGKIIESGDFELAKRLEKEGYNELL